MLLNHRSAARLYPAVLILLCVACLTACASGMGGEGGRDLPTQGEHNAFKAMILAQPEFTEEELLKFREDLAPTVDMPKEKALEYLEAAKGWPQNRSTYGHAGFKQLVFGVHFLELVHGPGRVMLLFGFVKIMILICFHALSGLW